MLYLDRIGHLISDISTEELHEFATKIGLKRSWYQEKGELSHYDLTTPNARRRARAAGAVEIDARELVRKLRGHGKCIG